jgi:carboxyl-terminal processing protease
MEARSPLRNLLLSIVLVVLGGVLGYRYKATELQGAPSLLGRLTQQVQPAQSKDDSVAVNTAVPSEHQEIDFSQFWKVWDILERDYLDTQKINHKQMVYGAIKGMTAALDDPYTMYLPPTEQKRSEEDLQGSFFGVGIQLGYVDNTLAVQSPIKGSPAERAGVKAKDLILHVKDEKNKLDEDTQGWTLEHAVDIIRGEKGTVVELTLYRKDDPTHKEPFKVSLERGEIVVPSAELIFKDKPNQPGKKVAVITLSRFGERTTGEMASIVKEIQAEKNTAGIVLDMRNNPGGYLDGAIDVASLFIKSGAVVTQQGKNSSHTYNSKGPGTLEKYPVVVLVNGGSASAAEIVTGALRDRRQAKLVGEKTFGKGTVQDALKLDGGAGLHVTIARWLLPGGSWIHKEGIPVQVEVKDDMNTEQDEALDRALIEL